jgi:hypothetical protein
MLARERWSQENLGTRRGLQCTAVAGGGEGHGFSYLLESHMTYLAGSMVKIYSFLCRLKINTVTEHTEHLSILVSMGCTVANIYPAWAMNTFPPR